MIIFEKNGQKYCIYNNKVMLYTDKVGKDEVLKTESKKSKSFSIDYSRPKSSPTIRYKDRNGKPIFVPLNECCLTDQALEKERKRKLIAILKAQENEEN